MKPIKILFLFVGMLVSGVVRAQDYVEHGTTNVADGTATTSISGTGTIKP